MPADAEGTAVLLYTSGTTSAPKAAVLRHQHLTSYVIGTVEYGGAEPDDAVLVSVPPYHVAGLANLLSNLYAGRRIVYLPQFDADEWVAAVRREGITNAMVVPTMLARIAAVLEGDGDGLPTLRSMSYGGARTPATVLERSWRCFPTSLSPTRTASPRRARRSPSSGPTTTAPHRRRSGRGGAAVVGRQGAADGRGRHPRRARSGFAASRCRASTPARASSLDADGWFPTRDRGWLDADGYLFIEGRSDDTIIRGGENIAPAEIEEVLLRHPGIEQCAVVGIPDDEWGQRIAAVVVARPGAALDADGGPRLRPRGPAGLEDARRRRLRRRAAVHRDRQAAAAGRAGRPRRA